MNLPVGQSCFLWGARKTGKSTFLQERYPQAHYLNFLHADVLRAYDREPERLRHEFSQIQGPQVIILDEVQKIPPLLDEVHGLIESCKNLQFILCGSSSRRLKTTGANLLGGRAWRYQFVPFCYAELKKLDWARIFNHGLLPSHYFSDHPEMGIASYVYDYLLSEVNFEANLRRRETFTHFIDILGFAQGEIISFSNIARDCGIDRKTAQTYFEILEDMYIGYFVHPYRKKSKRQTMQEMPKFYLFDTGIASYLRHFQFKEMQGTEAGKAFEHYVYLELMAYKLLNHKRDDIQYWRTKEGYEVDFVVQNLAIEIKISKSIDSKDLKGLKVFSEDYEHTLHLVCFEPRKRTIMTNNKSVTVWPVEEFLQALWAGVLW